ncbi:hypothetical protein [Clostridium sporogenes]|uniref:hypothetical protein n=1 Tax=Clostridium sporogenes TaxID=1509 RepID=UPI002237A073|nr:hypothetical protein [Clostridium sporogenes]MCW6107998.1 hypothetical protein [Clostridium sporogenes]
MGLDMFFQELKENLPDKSIDISESLELLKETINDTMEAIAVKVNEAILTRDLEKMKQYSGLVEQGHDYEVKIEEIIKMLDVEELAVKEEINENVDNKIIPNYDEYTVDNNIEHSLYENFTHIRPFGFKINNNKLIEGRTWQEVLIKTSEILFNKNRTKFLSFENNKNMNGKKNKYFSCKPEGIRKPELVANSIYLETNMSGNAIRNLIIKMLKQYDIKVSHYKVYFRADYSSLNKENL